MSDDDLIRRGDARLAVFKCHAGEWEVYGWGKIHERIAALPAVTVPDYRLAPHLQRIVEAAKTTPQWDTVNDRMAEQPAPDAAAIREAALREAAEICAGIRQRIANGPMPEGARFDYEQAILALLTEKPHDR